MFICYFIATVFFGGDQLFYSSTAYQTDFRNGTKYICRTQYVGRTKEFSACSDFDV